MKDIYFDEKRRTWNRSTKYIQKLRNMQDQLLKNVGIKNSELGMWYKISRRSDRVW